MRQATDKQGHQKNGRTLISRLYDSYDHLLTSNNPSPSFDVSESLNPVHNRVVGIGKINPTLLARRRIFFFSAIACQISLGAHFAATRWQMRE